MKDLLNCDGKRFKATIIKTPCKGVISVEKNKVYLCQDKMDGEGCLDKKGCNYSWVVNGGTAKDLNMFSVSNFELIPEEPKEGDYVYVSTTNPLCEDKIKRIFIAKAKGYSICVDISSEKEYARGDFFLVSVWDYMRPITEEDLIVEISKEEALQIIAENKGVKAEHLRIKD